MTMAAGLALGLSAASTASAQNFPPFESVSDGYTKVVSTTDGAAPMYTLWVRDRDGQMLAELPRNFEGRSFILNSTVKAGDLMAGLQGGSRYVHWKKYDNRLALIEPELQTRSTGDAESKASIQRHFTDRVWLDVPIVTMGPGGGPVIDLDALFVNGARNFFGNTANGLNPNLTKITKAKAFPNNVEIAVEGPVAGGQLRTFAYSLINPPSGNGYKPREADNRVGYFTTFYRDLGSYNSDRKWVRYVNRWHLEKRDPSLKLSPPKEPIVFYVEHTVPVRYRPYVRDGILQWNKAFEQIGIRDAIEVRYQDMATGLNMDIDPEDARYNFVVWQSNDRGLAVGPSRPHPETGQIFDADVVLGDGWLRVFAMDWENVMSSMLMEGMTPETLAWLETRPQYDPRIRLAAPEEREAMIAERQARQARIAAGLEERDDTPYLGTHWNFLGEDGEPLLPGEAQGLDMACSAAMGMAYSMSMLRTHLELNGVLDELRNGEGSDGNIIDGLPEEYVGPLLAHLVAHEIGHTLGLRHNFKGSSIFTIDEINSEAVKGQEPWANSVMDYSPLNINMDDEAVQGDYAPIGIGDYDMWAIEYGYTFGDPSEVAKRNTEPGLQYGSDEDTFGPDPFSRRYDLGADPHEYARVKMDIARHYRENLLDEFVKEGDNWAKARRGYQLSLSEQSGALGIMANWIGGSYVSRNQKGDPNAVDPVRPVEAEKQREALQFVVQNGFYDEAFGLTPEMLRHMTTESWMDPGNRLEEPTWPVHDRILGIQASMLTAIMNPTTLRRVYDNEFIVAPDEDALTLHEVVTTVTDAVWEELDGDVSKRYSVREPMISSMRRNLQAEHVDRLIDLTMPGGMFGAAARPISTLSRMTLTDLNEQIDTVLDGASANRLDPYTQAHLMEVSQKIEKALDADYIYNASSMGGGNIMSLFGKPAPGQ
jgi:hypothetical protein